MTLKAELSAFADLFEEIVRFHGIKSKTNKIMTVDNARRHFRI